jgi:hypothetical protein
MTERHDWRSILVWTAFTIAALLLVAGSALSD